VRLVDEFLAKSGVGSCQDFRETAEVVAKVAFKMFLGINVEVSQWSAEGNACSLLIYDNPLTGGTELEKKRPASSADAFSFCVAASCGPQSLWSCRRARTACSGTRTCCAACCEARWRWCRCASRRSS
jgi:hypothetical protein